MPVIKPGAGRGEQETLVPLPGTFDMAKFERVTAGVGKCLVCGLENAASIDRQAGVKLCEHCYRRETQSVSSRVAGFAGSWGRSLFHSLVCRSRLDIYICHVV